MDTVDQPKELEELHRLVQAKKLLNNNYLHLIYGAILFIPINIALYALLRNTSYEYVSLALASFTLIALLFGGIYLHFIHRSKIKNQIQSSGIKLLKNKILSVGDYCRPIHEPLPIYKVAEITDDKGLLKLTVSLSVNPWETGKIIQNPIIILLLICYLYFSGNLPTTESLSHLFNR